MNKLLGTIILASIMSIGFVAEANVQRPYSAPRSSVTVLVDEQGSVVHHHVRGQLQPAGEVIVYYNVEKMWSTNGWLHFSGKEGEEEAQSHSLNLDRIQRYKLLSGTLTVYFLSEEEEEEDQLPDSRNGDLDIDNDEDQDDEEKDEDQ